MATPTQAITTQDPSANVTLSQKMMSAVAGSILTSLLVTPLDVVRVRLQSQDSAAAARSRQLHSHMGISACCREVFWVNNKAPWCMTGPVIAPSLPPGTTCAVEHVERRTIHSTWDGLRKIAHHEGLHTLWRGLSPTLAMAVPANVIYFAGYDWLRTAPLSPLHKRVADSYLPLVAGATARIFAAVAVSPIEMLRTRMQAGNHTATAGGPFRETMDGLRHMVAVQGTLSLWRGLTLTLWRDVPFSAIYWWGYEATRDLLADRRSRIQATSHCRDFPIGQGDKNVHSPTRSRGQVIHTNTLFDSFLAGAVSGGVAALITTPFDVGKTRQQVMRYTGTTGNNAVHTTRPEDQAMPRFLMHIYSEQGLSGLFKGWAARCLKIAPACAIMISCYEFSKKMALDLNQRRERERA